MMASIYMMTSAPLSQQLQAAVAVVERLRAIVHLVRDLSTALRVASDPTEFTTRAVVAKLQL